MYVKPSNVAHERVDKPFTEVPWTRANPGGGIRVGQSSREAKNRTGPRYPVI